MNNNRITSKQMISTLILFILGSTVVIGETAKQDSWICIIIGLALALPMMFVYARILKLYPGQGFYDIVITLFGKFWGKLIVLIYTIYSIHLGSIVTRSFSEFVVLVSMPGTPKIVLTSFLILICIWIAKSGIKNLGRTSQFVLPLTLAITLLTILFSIKNMDLSNLLPVMGSDLKTIAIGSITFFSLPFCEVALLTAMFSSVSREKSPHHILNFYLLISGLLYLAIMLRNILVLGAGAGSLYYFPSYETVSVISLGDFFTRIEITIGINLMLAGVIKVSCCITSAAMGFSKLFNLNDNRLMAAPVGLIMLTFSVIAFSNSEQLFDIIKVYPLLTLPYQVILPLIILAAAEIKTRLAKLPDANTPPQPPAS